MRKIRSSSPSRDDEVDNGRARLTSLLFFFAGIVYKMAFSLIFEKVRAKEGGPAAEVLRGRRRKKREWIVFALFFRAPGTP